MSSLSTSSLHGRPRGVHGRGMLAAAIASLACLAAQGRAAHAAEGIAAGSTTVEEAGSADATAADPDSAYADILRSFRRRTDESMSPEALRFDTVARDSAITAFDDSVSARGLASRLSDLRDDEIVYRRRLRGGFEFGGTDVSLAHTKVDGPSFRFPLEAWTAFDRVYLEARASVGYAFGSKRGRHRAEIQADTNPVTIGVQHRRLAERFGWTEVHGATFASLLGVDEQRYLERRGWGVFVEPHVNGRIDARLTYDDEDQVSLRAHDTFTIAGDADVYEGDLYRANPMITEGRSHRLGLRVDLRRDRVLGVWGRLELETAGRGLGGDLDFDRVFGRMSYRPVLPWRDEIELTATAQMTAGPGEIPVQALATVAGRSGVRGVDQSNMIGTHGLHLRVEYHIVRDLLRRARVPFLGERRIQFVPFADVGAAWTPDDVRTLGDATLPASNDWKWGVGLGLRRAVGLGEVLSHIRLDVAWRLDRAGAGPVTYVVLESQPFR